MKIISEFTGKEYEEDDCIPYGNATQSAQYCLWGAKLVDVFATDERRFVFVFTREDHRKYIGKWKAMKPTE